VLKYQVEGSSAVNVIIVPVNVVIELDITNAVTVGATESSVAVNVADALSVVTFVDVRPQQYKVCEPPVETVYVAGAEPVNHVGNPGKVPDSERYH
jgi:hypothetical protein